MVLIRSKKGIFVDVDHPLFDAHIKEVPIYAFFFVVSPEDNPGQHLRVLAQIAGHVDDEGFMKNWLSAENDHMLREILLRDERFLHMVINEDSKSGELIGKEVRDLDLPEGSLIAVIQRENDILIPRGSTVLNIDDRLTIIADPDGINKIHARFYT